MFEVSIDGLQFYGFHGVGSEERSVGHRYVANILAVVGPQVGKSDRIEDTVDYIALARELLELSQSRSFHTLEALAMTFAQQSLHKFETIREIEIEVAKMYPPAAIIAESVSVRYRAAR